MTASERGAELRAERQRRKLSLYRTAMQVGCHPNTILAAEKGACSEQMMQKIAAALGLKVEAPRP